MFSLLQDFLILGRTGRLGLRSEANEPYSVSSYGAVVELETGKYLKQNKHSDIWGPILPSPCMAKQPSQGITEHIPSQSCMQSFTVQSVCIHSLAAVLV